MFNFYTLLCIRLSRALKYYEISLIYQTKQLLFINEDLSLFILLASLVPPDDGKIPAI